MQVNLSESTRVRHTLRTACIVGSLVLGACSDEVASPRPLEAGDIRTSVTPELASSLGADGRFVLPQPPLETYDQLSPGEAAEIAVAWARTFGRYVRDDLERIHGRRIDFDRLRAGSPAYYAAAVYEPVEPWVAPGIRNAFGPQYLVYLVDDGGSPVLSVAVAAFGQARVESGVLRLPSAGGMEVVPDAVRSGQGFAAPLSPEQAVSIASRATAARVASVPELVMPGRGYHPHFARWRVTLELPVAARVGSRAAERMTREVYVGPRGELAVSAEAQPEGAGAFDPPSQKSLTLVRRATRPVAFERAEFR
jgi:hypothetical protein